jgi:hypothetical protein
MKLLISRREIYFFRSLLTLFLALCVWTSASAQKIFKYQSGVNGPSGIHIQLSSLLGGNYSGQTITPAVVDTMFQQLCAINNARRFVEAEKTKALNSPGQQFKPYAYVGPILPDLVLTDTADADGNLYPALATVEKYFGCFDNVFLGTIDPLYFAIKYPPTQRHPSHPLLYQDYEGYKATFKDGNFRWAYVVASGKVAQKLAARYSAPNPHVTFSWYLSPEAILNAFNDPELVAVYEATYIDMVTRMRSARAATVLWSPAFFLQDEPDVVKQTISVALRRFFENIKAYDPSARGIDWIDLQDGVGAKNLPANADRSSLYGMAASYFNLLRQSSIPRQQIRMNVESFVALPVNSFVASSQSEVTQREIFYKNNFIPMGATFEIRYFMQNHSLSYSIVE